MPADEIRRRSRWMIRALEWDDPRAKYPNLWHDGMLRHLLAHDTVAGRLRLGDLVAVFHPASTRHPDRSERFVGIARVEGLRRSDSPGLHWIDLATAHRFKRPLDLGAAPRRVFLCCDQGWPAPEVDLFRRLFEAAVSEGWRPSPFEREGHAGAESHDEEGIAPEATAPFEEEAPAHISSAVVRHIEPSAGGRIFAGADFSGDMRDPKDATWLALIELVEDRLRVLRLEATGRAGLQARLRDPDGILLRAEAIGLDFPFGVPLGFAESIVGGPLPEEGWWSLARKLERMTRPEYLVALQEYRDARGEEKRAADEVAGAFSPLHRTHPDLGPMTYHGIRTIAEERSRYAIRPFETARGRLLLEVYPGGAIRRLTPAADAHGEARLPALVTALEQAERLPVAFEESLRSRCVSRRDALDAVVAARCAAQAVLDGETEKSPEDLLPGQGPRVHVEGWIYGLGEPGR